MRRNDYNGSCATCGVRVLAGEGFIWRRRIRCERHALVYEEMDAQAHAAKRAAGFTGFAGQ